MEHGKSVIDQNKFNLSTFSCRITETATASFHELQIKNDGNIRKRLRCFYFKLNLLVPGGEAVYASSSLFEMKCISKNSMIERPAHQIQLPSTRSVPQYPSCRDRNVPFNAHQTVVRQRATTLESTGISEAHRGVPRFQNAPFPFPADVPWFFE